MIRFRLGVVTGIYENGKFTALINEDNIVPKSMLTQLMKGPQLLFDTYDRGFIYYPDRQEIALTILNQINAVIESVTTESDSVPTNAKVIY